MHTNEKKMTPKEKEMATANIPRLVLSYSIPTVIGMLISALYVVVDRYFVGQIPDIGQDALTGVGLGSPVNLILAAFSLLLGVGSAANISIRLGKGDRDGAEQVLGNALSFILITSVVLGAAALIFMEPLLIAFGADASTLPHAYTYAAIKVIGTPLMFIFFAMNHPIRAVGSAKRFAAAQIMGALLNIVLNPLFIFTFNMGIAGAAWSTVLVWGLGGIWVMMYYFKGEPAIKIRLKYLKPSLKVLGIIASIGMAPFFMQILGSAVTIIANRSLAELGGSVSIAAFTAINGVIALFIMPVFGITQGSQPIIGFNYGMGNMQRVRAAYISSMLYSIIICIVGSTLLLILPKQVMELFNSDPDALAIGTTAMRIMVWSLAVAGFQMNASTFFMSIGRAKISVFLSVLRLGIILIPLFFILPQVFGALGINRLLGIWWAYPVSDVLAFTVSIIMILRELRIIKAKTLDSINS